MLVKSEDEHGVRGWEVDPFGELQRLWQTVNEGKHIGVPHIVGRASVADGKVSGLEMSVILNETEKEYSFRDGDDVYFMLPARPEEGVEGIYVRLNRLLGDAE